MAPAHLYVTGVAAYPAFVFSHVLRDSTPHFVGPSVCPSVTLYFFLGFCGFWLHCSCPNDLVTSIKAPAHPHATGVAVYPALFNFKSARGAN